MFTSQSNTQAGARKFIAASDLTGKQVRLLVLKNSAGVNQVDLPAAITDHTPVLLVDGEASGVAVTVEPFSPDKNFRVTAKGTFVCGDLLTAAAIAGSDAGKLRKLPATTGTFHVIAIAEETAADAQLALVRPCGRFAVVVP